VIVREAEEVASKYGRPRRTEIADAKLSDVATKEELIPDEKGMILFSEGGYIKRICDTTFSTQVLPCACLSLVEQKAILTIVILSNWLLSTLRSMCSLPF
jgi:DNA gyrase/topoisomerase IV subunit A